VRLSIVPYIEKLNLQHYLSTHRDTWNHTQVMVESPHALYYMDKQPPSLYYVVTHTHIVTC
jgi:hypothetical protein